MAIDHLRKEETLKLYKKKTDRRRDRCFYGRPIFYVLFVLLLAFFVIGGIYIWGEQIKGQDAPNLYLLNSGVSCLPAIGLMLLSPTGKRAVVCKMALVGGFISSAIAVGHNDVVFRLFLHLFPPGDIADSKFSKHAVKLPDNNLILVLMQIEMTFFEEVCKLGMLILLTRLIRPQQASEYSDCNRNCGVTQVSKPRHFAYYGLAVAFGFSRIENFYYFIRFVISRMTFEQQLINGTMRSFALLHEVWTLIAASVLALIYYRNGRFGVTDFLKAVAIPSLLHALHNIACMLFAVKLGYIKLTIGLVAIGIALSLSAIFFVYRKLPKGDQVEAYPEANSYTV